MAEDILNFLTYGGTNPQGESFFNTLARYLALNLRMDFVCIDSLEGDGLTARTLAVWCDGKFEDNVTYALKDTPCGDVVGKTICCFPANVCQLFPHDQVLQDLRAESYIGVTLWNHAGKPIGLIALISRSAMLNRLEAEETLRLVAARAAGELERLHVEAELQKNIDILNETGAMGKIGGWELDLATGRPKWTDETFRIFGLDPAEKELLLPDGLNCYAPSSRPKIAQAVQRAIEYGESYDMDVELITRNGNRIWVRTNGRPTRENGKVTKLSGTIQDITDRKIAEIALAEKEVQYRNLADSGLALIWTAGLDKLCNYFNKPWLQFTGRTLEQELGDGWLEGVHPDDLNRCLNVYVTAFDKREPFDMEYRLRHASGAYRWVRDMGSPTYNSHGEFSGYIGHCFDITDAKYAEAKIHEKDIQFRKLSLNVPDLIFQFTRRPDGTYCVPIASQGIKNIFGCLPEDVLEDFSPIGRVIFPEDAERVISAIEYSAKNLTFFTCEFRVQIPGKPIQWILSRSTPERLDDGSITWYGFNTDITERKQAEEREGALRAKLDRAARIESLGVLAGGVAHDLNNVLGPILVLPDMVIEYIERCGVPSDPEHSETLEALQTMKTSALRAAAVVSDLVSMGRREQLNKSPVDVNLVVDRVLDSKQIRAMLDRWPSVHIATDLTITVAGCCLGSESGLTRVLSNLVGNAIEAVEGVGDIVVRTGVNTFTEPYNGYEKVPAGTYVTIEVADTGSGIDPDDMSRIFEPFFSTKAPSERSGSGLGLSVVYGLVKDHEGFLDVRSLPGKGTTFTVILPAVDSVAGSVVSNVPINAEVLRGQERILVVDDEPGQLVLSKRALKKLGYNVTVASNGEDAITMFEASKLDGNPAPFDLVITDMVMESMDGLILCQKILQLYPLQKLIIASGHSAESKQKQAEELGAAWLTKPYSSVDLARTVRSRLGS